MCFGKAIVERDGAPQWLDRTRRHPGAVVGERELVENGRRAVVDAQIALVIRRGRGVLTGRGVHIAERFDRAQGGGVERLGLSEIAQRSTVVAAPPIGIASLQVGEHRSRLECERAAEGLDRVERPVGHNRLVARSQQSAELALLAHVRPDEHCGGDRHRNADGHNQGAFHRAKGADGGTAKPHANPTAFARLRRPLRTKELPGPDGV